MNQKSNKKLTHNAQSLRRNMTKEERHLWYDFLKTLPVNIHRQKVIGNYIVDFYCAKANVVIELDGSQHYSQNGKEQDQKRDSFLKGMGLTVLRYSNLDIQKRFEGVCLDILKHLKISDKANSSPYQNQ